MPQMPAMPFGCLRCFAMPKFAIYTSMCGGISVRFGREVLECLQCLAFWHSERSPMGDCIPQFFKTSQYPLMTCAARRCRHCLEALPAKLKWLANVSIAGLGPFRYFWNLRETPEIISNVKLFRIISDVKFFKKFFNCSELPEALQNPFELCGPFLEDMRTDRAVWGLWKSSANR